MKKIILTILTVTFVTVLFAQTPIKIGYINSQELLQIMPESDTAQMKLEKATKEYQDQFQVMQVEYNKKKQEFMEKQNTYSGLIKQTKDAELQQIGQRLQQFQQSASEDLQKQRNDIFKPVLDKANKAIADVAKENGFTYILDLSQGTVLYHADSSNDILPLVKQKLGLTKKTKSSTVIPAKK